MSPMNLLNDDEFAVMFRRVKATHHEKRHGTTGRSEFHADPPLDPSVIDVTEETVADRDVAESARTHIRTHIRRSA